jgi:predicted O-methyltransferase YrrM
MPIVTTVRGRACSGPHIFIAIPTHSDICASTFTSFFEAAQMLDAAGFNMTLCVESGNCHVDDARNSLVREFLKTDATDMVFIDADVGFRPEDLHRLVSVDRDIVAGVYPKKETPEDFPVYTLGGVELRADADGLVEVEAVPTGFLRIRRTVLQALSDQAQGFIGQAGDPLPYKVVFERMIDGGRRWSGDYGFCRKAKKAGYRIYVDPEMQFTHTGTHVWAGSLGSFWKRRHGVEAVEAARKLDRSIKALISGNPTAQDFHDLVTGWGNGYSATPELLAEIWTRCEGSVLECGTGLSTIVLAAKRCEVTSLEHDPMYASHIRAVLDRHDLKANIECRPLVGRWYDHPGGDYDCLLIDGPPRAMSNRTIALERVSAELVIWDDYVSGLDDPEVTEVGEHRFAVLETTEG